MAKNGVKGRPSSYSSASYPSRCGNKQVGVVAAAFHNKSLHNFMEFMECFFCMTIVFV